ncbi:hypothetical protein C5B96_06380 [Subtercola sp. Z020]|uniref:hypothetical protein n=1 Tax=Subtercola sp. Z020 TaxID=2080582 RepID=UPI000CE8DA47|nr:hypothetical protein [Subtercola sp. Z020]PPF85217.1 hypothetical protein C5B96_06380 [Subtercola sp. Z020]
MKDGLKFWNGYRADGLDFVRSHVEELTRLALRPETRLPFAVEGMRALGPITLPFYGESLSLLAPRELEVLAGEAVTLLRRTERGSRGAAAAVIAHASLQVPSVLTPHLPELFQLLPNEAAYYGEWPWRGADSSEVARLGTVARKAEEPPWHLCGFLVGARSDEALALAQRLFAPIDSPRLDRVLRQVGRELVDHRIRPLTSEAVFHVVFDDDYLRVDYSDPEHVWTHPTLLAEGLPAERSPFGGVLAERCGRCATPLARLLELSAILPELGVHSRSQVQFATCLWCQGSAEAPLYFSHDESGTPASLPEVRVSQPSTRHLRLNETVARVQRTRQRWRFQDWGLSTHRQNLHRVGGEPTFIGQYVYPRCPRCSGRMPFLLQFDSWLPLEGDAFLHWGGEGLAYLFWCDPCATSATFVESP